MSNFLPIYYSGFWDVPLSFLTVFDGELFLFWKDFDDELDDYEPNYRVYLIKNTSLEDAFKPNEPPHISVTYRSIPLLLENEIIGEISTKEVVFDETNRKLIDSYVLEKLIKKIIPNKS